MGQEILFTERLRLEPISVHHAPQVLKMVTSELFIQNIGKKDIETEEQAAKFIEKVMAGEGPFVEYYNFIGFRKSDNAYVGNSGFFRRKNWKGMDLGYSFLKEFHGNGYATEAAGAIVDLAFNEYNITELRAVTLPSNIPSQRVLIKLGFDRDGTDFIPDVKDELDAFILTKKKYHERK